MVRQATGLPVEAHRRIGGVLEWKANDTTGRRLFYVGAEKDILVATTGL
jgi:hypothetical protein